MRRSLGRGARARGGFVLITVMWVMTLAAVVALAAEFAGRDAYDAGRNRVYATRSYWRAADCLARSRAAIDAVLGTTSDPALLNYFWQNLDRAVREDPLLAGPGCLAELTAVGTRMNVNTASDTLLLGLFREMGYGSEAQAMLAALRDWTDTDNVQRPYGAEADWYAAHGRPTPRNGPLADIRELTLVRGFEQTPPILDSVLTVEPGRISLANASLAVIAAIPGFTPEALDRLAQIRETGEPLVDLTAFAASLSPQAMRQMAAHFEEISQLVTVVPDAWIIRATGAAGRPPIATTIEVRIARAGNQVVVTRRRIDP